MNCIDTKIVAAFIDSDYDYIQTNLAQIRDSPDVDLLADLAILKKDRKLMSYLNFHPRHLINKHKNSHDNLEFLLDFMKTSSGDNFAGFTCYNYYLEDLTDRKTLDLYAKYEMDFSDCEIQFIDDPELQELAIEYGVPDTQVTLDRFIKYLELFQNEKEAELSQCVVDEIENDIETYYDQFEAELPENWRIFYKDTIQ